MDNYRIFFALYTSFIAFRLVARYTSVLPPFLHTMHSLLFSLIYLYHLYHWIIPPPTFYMPSRALCPTRDLVSCTQHHFCTVHQSRTSKICQPDFSPLYTADHDSRSVITHRFCLYNFLILT